MKRETKLGCALSFSTSHTLEKEDRKVSNYSGEDSGPGVREQRSRRVTATMDSDGICHVVLNRPEKLNALDLPMFEALAETASNLRTDKSLRAVILRGEGRAFCTGLDVVRLGFWFARRVAGTRFEENLLLIP